MRFSTLQMKELENLLENFSHKSSFFVILEIDFCKGVVYTPKCHKKLAYVSDET